MPVARIMEQAIRIHLGDEGVSMGCMCYKVKMLTGTPSTPRLPSTSVKSVLDDGAPALQLLWIRYAVICIDASLHVCNVY